VTRPTVIGQAANFNICFQTTTLSSHAGVVMLKEFSDRLGVPLLLQGMEVKQRARGYDEAASILGLCWNAILGGDCLLDLNVLRGEIGTQQLLGVSSLIAPTTAGEFLRKFGIGEVTALRSILGALAQARLPQSLQRSDRVRAAVLLLGRRR
jgi:hypothetical protein